MPVVETKRGGRGPRDRALLTELIQELRNPREAGQPLVEIREMDRGFRHVHVFWDKWDGCEPESRGEIVRAAFREVKGPEYETAIAIAVPATIPEAAEMGLLPFQVKSLGWDRATAKTRQAATRALIEMGASTLGAPAIPALHYSSAEAAGASVQRLKARTPDLDWYVLETRLTPV